MQRFTGKQYLQLDIASTFGLDKSTWDERLEWFDANQHQLEALLDQAEEPALYYAGVQAWRTTEAGQATGYPISIDATSSGLQILACLTGDRLAAQLCNVIDTGRREDAYTNVYLAMLDEYGGESKIDRKDTKQAIMTSLYGSQAIPKQVFGDGELLLTFYKVMGMLAPGAWELNQAFLSMWDKTALSNDWVLPDNFHVRVKVMDRIKEVVHFQDEPFDTFRMVNQPIEAGRSLGANVTHSLDGMIVREMARRCMYNPLRVACVQAALDGAADPKPDDPTSPAGRAVARLREKDTEMVIKLWDHFLGSGYLSARILDHLHSDNVHLVDDIIIRELILSLPAKPFEVISIHDCFRCLPNYGNDLRQQYNLQLQLIAKSDLLSWLLSQINKREIVINKLDPELWREIGDANYALS